MDATSTGPGVADGPEWRPWAQAWETALYGPAGFYRRNVPAAHFTTSARHGTVLAHMVRRLVRDNGLDHVVDVGAGSGELVRALHTADPGLRLTAVEVRARPPDLPSAIDWTSDVPRRIDGVLFANEYLDNVPCPVVQRDDDGNLRTVEVDPTGRERLGPHAPDSDIAWLRAWWPLSSVAPRAEVGAPRDERWSALSARVRNGYAVAVDYGHLRTDRPAHGSLRAYRHGREVDVVPDGLRDITAHVAVDAVAAASSGHVLRQREAVGRWADEPSLPSYQQARVDPQAALRRVAAMSERGVLRARGGLGDFWWVVVGRGDLAATIDMAPWRA
jgi:SAM-dependent MidA family methyltransferase